MNFFYYKKIQCYSSESVYSPKN